MRTKKMMAALLVGCLAVAGCQNTDSGLEAEVPGSASVTEDTVAPSSDLDPFVDTTVRLIEQGSEPRSELRFAFEDGQSEVLAIEQSGNVFTTFDGGPVDSYQTGVVNRIQVDVETVEAGYRVNTVVLAAEPGTNMDAATEAEVAPGLEATVGRTSTFIMNDRGVVVDSEDTFDDLGVGDNSLAEMVSRFGIQVALPNEAVGVGAVWEVTKVRPFQGINVTETTTYRITDISESVVSLETETVQTVDLGIPTDADGILLEFRAWDSTGSGTGEIDLSSVVPTLSGSDTTLFEAALPGSDQVAAVSTNVGQYSLSPSTFAAPSPSDTASSSPPADSPALEELRALAEETIALPRMSFELDVTSTLPGIDASVLARQTGSFDDDSLSGFGTRSFETDGAGIEEIQEIQEMQEIFGAEPFEFRYIDETETYWMYNPLSDPPGWGGFDVFEFAELAGGDPLGTVDGDQYLGLLVSATVDVVGTEQQADGSTNWLLRVRADDLVPMVAAAGPASRLIALGATDSGLEVNVELVQAPEGYFSGSTFDMSEWWANALSLLAPFEGDESMTVEFRLDPFDVPLNVEAPCESPETQTDANGMTALACS